MLSNKMLFINQCFNSLLLVFYMFRTSYVHHQEDYIVHAALCAMFFMLMTNVRCSKHVEDKKN